MRLSRGAVFFAKTPGEKFPGASKYILISMALAAAAMTAVYILSGIYPFGDATVVTGDLGGMYLPFYAHAGRGFSEGFSFFSFEKGLGGGTQGLIAYIPAALYMLLTPLFGEIAPSDFFGALLFFKIIFAAGTFCFFIGRKSTPSMMNALLGFCYAMMSYNMVYAQNIMWLDNVVLLPVMLHTIELLTEKKRSAPFVATLSLAVLSNYYTAFMLSLFAVLYFFWHTLGEKRMAFWETGARFIRFSLSGILAAAIPSALLLPMALQTLQNKGFLSAAGNLWSSSLADLPRQLSFGGFSWDQVENGAPVIYCGCLGLAGAVLYFTSGAPDKREKLFSAAMTAVLTLSFLFAPLNRVWHIFRDPVWFPFRYSFLFPAFILLLAAKAYGGRPPAGREAVKWGAVLGVALLAIVLPQAGMLSAKKLFATSAVIAGLFVVLQIIRNAGTERTRRLFGWILAAAVFSEMALGGSYIFRQFPLANRSALQTESDAVNALLTVAEQNDTGFYRLEKDSFLSLNDPMYFGYNGLNHFSSVSDSASENILKLLGYGSIYKNPTFALLPANALLGIKYFIAKESFTPPETGGYLPAAGSLNHILYENASALPFAFFAEEIGAHPGENAFDNLNAVYSDILGRDVRLFRRLASESAGDIHTLEGSEDDMVYASFLAKTDGSFITVDGESRGEAGFYSERGIVPLGVLREGAAVEINGYDFEFYSLDGGAFADAVGDIRETAGKTAVKNGRIESLASFGREGYLLFSMPYYADWQAEVNGEKAELSEAFGGFAALRLPAGENKVVLRYVPRGFYPGIAVSAISLAVFSALIFREKGRYQPRRAKTPKKISSVTQTVF